MFRASFLAAASTLAIILVISAAVEALRPGPGGG
jgi:hypothetical protein